MQEGGKEVTEIWKDIMGFEGYYSISSHGNVMNVRKLNVLRSEALSADYKRVLLCKEGNSKTFAINRLVALHYVENPFNKPIVHHIDENKWNNIYTNLLWATPAENSRYHYDYEREKLKQFMPGELVKVIGTEHISKVKYARGQIIVLEDYINDDLEFHYSKLILL
jgi:hypothetical protein